ncbi:hypothetical protein SEETMRM10961_13575 [Salmonella enterica subsp. enterica serovar Typhimurium]|nr:hypothetical protein SEETMRM10961_13575 [Salmonella enterica subsp. enterica serovar Typhimurium]
MVKNLVGHKKV